MSSQSSPEKTTPVKLTEEAMQMQARHHLPPPLGGYTFSEHLGSTLTHDTFAATRNECGTPVVVRVYALAYLKQDEERRQMIEREVLVTRQVQHPRVVEVFPPFMTKTDLFLVEKAYSGGELFDALESYCRASMEAKKNTDSNNNSNNANNSSGGGICGLPIIITKRIFKELMEAVQYLHAVCGICHRNIKLENVALDEDNSVRLGGFGMSAVLAPNKSEEGKKRQMAKMKEANKDQSNSSEESMLELCCGSKHYVAPEVVESRSYDGAAVDVWAAGVVLFALLTGNFPFDSEKGDEVIFHQIRNAEKYLETNSAFNLIEDPLAQDLVRNMLRVDPRGRLSVDEIMEHPFVTS